MAGFGSPFYCAAGEELGGHAVYRGVFPNVVSTSPQCGSEAKRCFASTSPLRGYGVCAAIICAMRVCQPRPEARQRASTSGGRRKEIYSLAGFLPAPRTRRFRCVCNCARSTVTTAPRQSAAVVGGASSSNTAVSGAAASAALAWVASNKGFEVDAGFMFWANRQEIRCAPSKAASQSAKSRPCLTRLARRLAASQVMGTSKMYVQFEACASPHLCRGGWLRAHAASVASVRGFGSGGGVYACRRARAAVKTSGTGAILRVWR